MAGPLFKFKLSWIPLFYACTTWGSMMLSLFFAFRYHYTAVIRNHCKGPGEFWPTISATIGDWVPERNIFHYFMALTSGPRLIMVMLNYQLFKEEQNGPAKEAKATWKLNIISAVLDIIRIFSAGGWIYITSSDFLRFHEVSFILYVLSSFIYMGTHCTLFYQVRISQHRRGGRPVNAPSPSDQKSLRWKLIFFALHVILFFSSLHFFFEHILHCVPAAYSYYALFEWVLAFCNVAFDATF
eukprot:TRINITY_DN15451_c0_g1_i1.p1 TRINITY_DN15451_c0_g1~~TRINITY_DN15451_c0_g1_i1.p1  ORF type:complete len:261 (-),score=27.06 TRINITY_DN15451_c0_g1_i1:74-796(-)